MWPNWQMMYQGKLKQGAPQVDWATAAQQWIKNKEAFDRWQQEQMEVMQKQQQEMSALIDSNPTLNQQPPPPPPPPLPLPPTQSSSIHPHTQSSNLSHQQQQVNLNNSNHSNELKQSKMII
jgi:hypothetical protein